MAKRFLTLNIGAANIELAEYEQGGRSLTLVNYGVAPLAAPLDGGNAETILSPALLQLVRERGFKPGRVALSVSGQMVFPKFAAIPMAGGSEKFEQLVRYEVEQGIPFPIDEMVCDRQILGDTESGDKSVMIVAAKVDQIESITSALLSIGFTPSLVDVSPIALINAIEFGRGGDESCIVALDIGAKTTSLAIVEGEKIYLRSIPVAGNAITKDVAGALGVSTEEAEALKLERGYVSLGGVSEDEDGTTDCISKACRAVMTRLNAEIARSINFYRSQQKGSAPTKLYLTGGSALLPQIDEFFASELGIPVEFFNPFERIAVGRSVDAASLESNGAMIAATAGLALHEAGHARFTINLLPPSIVNARADIAKIPLVAAGGLCLVLAIVLVALGFRKESDVLDERLAAATAELSSLTQMNDAVTKENKNFELAKDRADALRAVLASRTTAVSRLAAVCSAFPKKAMWIESWTPDGEMTAITIRYWKEESDSELNGTIADNYVKALTESDVVASASIRDKAKTDKITGKIGGEPGKFIVQVKFK